MGALKIVATIVMGIFFINIVRRLIMGEIKVAAWKNGSITDEDGTRLRLSSSRSLWRNFGFLVIAMLTFIFSE